MLALYPNTFPLFLLQPSIWNIFSLTSSLLFWLCSSDLAVSKFGQFFCVLYKSCFLNVTDECVMLSASCPSCQIVKAVIPLHAAGVTIQYCSWENTAFSTELLFKKRSSSLVMGDNTGCHCISPWKGDCEIPPLNAKLIQWIFLLKYVSIYEC